MDKSKPALGTVTVPEPLIPLFLRAQEYVSRYFADRLEDPLQGTISISGERYVLMRAASLSVEFLDLVLSLYRDQDPAQARSVANNLLFDLAHSIGKADARAFHARMGVTNPIERLSAGPVHFSFAGWARVRILPESSPTPDPEFVLVYDHPFSFESDAWVQRGRRSEEPVCIMNAGYSSGWCEESFGLPLVAAEVECLARGDARCRFIMAPPERIESQLGRYFASATGAPPPWWRSKGVQAAVPEYFQRKRLEEELHRSHADLERRVRERTEELARANQALQQEIVVRQRAEEERRRIESGMLQAQKLESLGVLAGGIAHDFNNMLVSVLGNAGIALAELPADSPVRETLRQIEVAATRAADLTRQLLAYSGRARFVLESIDLTALVNEMASLLAPVVGTQARLRLDLDRELPWVQADPTQLRQVVMNLITNASDALGDRPGEIVVRTGFVTADPRKSSHVFLDGPSPNPRCVFLEVVDTGMGMDEATASKIFDPFFTTKFQGRGLGLAAVLGIVRAHRGAVDVRSTPGTGTTIRVLLPALPAAGAPRPVTVPAPPPAADVPSALILVVDDHEGARRTAERILERQGYRVLLARDGRQAIQLHRERAREIDAVVLDLTMPGLGGLETLAELRKHDPDVRVVLSSGYAEEEVERRCAHESVAGFLQKPYRVDDLLTKVREALRRP